jgi:hypothetical protein
VAARFDGLVVVRAAATGETATSWNAGHEVSPLAWTKDSARVVSGGSSQVITVWEAASGRRLTAYATRFHPVRDFGMDPTGRRLAVTGEELKPLDGRAVIQILDTTTGDTQLIYREHTAAIPEGRPGRQLGIGLPRSTTPTPACACGAPTPARQPSRWCSWAAGMPRSALLGHPTANVWQSRHKEGFASSDLTLEHCLPPSRTTCGRGGLTGLQMAGCSPRCSTRGCVLRRDYRQAGV